jgi:hypothetical protein
MGHSSQTWAVEIDFSGFWIEGSLLISFFFEAT